MNCIEVSIKKLNEKLNPTILKNENINVQSFSIGEKLNSKIEYVPGELKVNCSIICDTSLL